MPIKKIIAAFLIFLLAQLGCGRVNSNEEFIDDGLAPAVPSGLRVYAAYDGRVITEWLESTEPDLKEYVIYRSTGDSLHFLRIASTQRTFFVDDSLSYDSLYYYRIAAADMQGRISMPTYFVSAKPVNRLVPDVIRHINAYGRNWNGTPSVSLEWELGNDTDIDHYLIYRSTQAEFQSDTSGFIAASKSNFYNDTSSIQTYREYYYRVVAVDKGGLKGRVGAEASDMVHEIVMPVYPQDNSTVGSFRNIKLRALRVPARYRVVLQSNEYYGELWSSDFTSTQTTDTLVVAFNPYILKKGHKYFWRVITFSRQDDEPNSISPFYTFTFRGE